VEPATPQTAAGYHLNLLTSLVIPRGIEPLFPAWEGLGAAKYTNDFGMLSIHQKTKTTIYSPHFVPACVSAIGSFWDQCSTPNRNWLFTLFHLAIKADRIPGSREEHDP